MYPPLLLTILVYIALKPARIYVMDMQFQFASNVVYYFISLLSFLPNAATNQIFAAGLCKSS